MFRPLELEEVEVDGRRWAPKSRRARWQAIGLAVVLPVDAVLAYVFGAPLWIALLYAFAGLALAALRVHFALRGERAAAVAVPIAATPPAVAAPPRLRAIGYVYVTDAGTADLAEQTAVIARCCRERSLQLPKVVHDVDSVGRGDDRPSLVWALEQIAHEHADVLVIARLGDLSTKVAELAALLSWFDGERRTLIAVDLQIDTSTEAGRLAATAIVGVGGWEHERISERTRQGLKAARERGGGHGRTAVADLPELQERISHMREEGMTLQAIADVLNEEEVPTLRGGAMWRPSSVQRATGYKRPSSGRRGIELPKANPADR